MTFLQQALGRNYKWWYVLKFAFKSNTTYRGNSIMWLLSSVITMAGMIFVWYISYFRNDNLLEFSSIFTYFIIGEAFIFSSAIQYDIGENILDGKITTKLLRPSNVFGFYICNSFGYQLFENLIRTSIYLSIALIFSQYFLFFGITNFLLFLIFCFFAILLNILFGLITGLTAFWLKAYFGSAQFFYDLKLILSGRFFPLNLTSKIFYNFLIFLPFSFTFYHPMQIYLGKYSQVEIAQTFVGGVLWCLVLWILARLVFKAGLKKNEAVGL
jgi:ABC-2 type transport system permease protein